VIRAVLDVNILISAFIGGADGPPRKLIYAWREGRFTLVVSPALLAELGNVLGRPRFERWAADERAALWIASLSAGGVHRDDPDTPPVGTRDPRSRSDSAFHQMAADNGARRMRHQVREHGVPASGASGVVGEVHDAEQEKMPGDRE
jgi:predicted nucleic acid-binding protein